MTRRSLVPALASLGLLLLATPARAQIGSFCLRPLGIPDKWIESQTPPWDPTDTFDPTGSNPDLYFDGASGFDPAVDHGLAMSLVLYNRIDPPQGNSAWPIVVSEPGSARFESSIVACSGYPHSTGQSFPSVTGIMENPLSVAMQELIAQDPAAIWDPAANGGRGGVANSGFPQSPRIIALPVFAPNAYGTSTSMSPPMVKIVGFFVSERLKTSGGGVTIKGHLTASSTIAMETVTARYGDWAQLSATFTGAGSPVFGVPIEFVYDDMVVAVAETDGTGTARAHTTAFRVQVPPGEYAGAIRARLGQSSGAFFTAEDAVADLAVRKKLPVIQWPQPGDITYGTPLGPQHLNAVADVPGQFIYSPAAGTVLAVTHTEAAWLAVTFVPDQSEAELYDEATAINYIFVSPAPLAVKVNNVSKLYLDPLPAFSLSATGFVNGEDSSVLTVGPTWITSATASSPVGTYSVMPELIDAPNYDVTFTPGVLTIVPRPTVATLQLSGPSPSTYGQTLTATIGVASGVGVPAGTVTLTSGGVPLASAALVNGQATLTLSTLNAGAHTLSAQYTGSSGFAPSVSTSIAHTVAAADTTTSLTSSLNPSRTGQAVTFTATVSAVAPGSGTVSGTVEFLRAGVVIGTATLSGEQAGLTIDNLAAGKHTIQARYVGTVNYLTSVSAAIQQSVKGAGK